MNTMTFQNTTATPPAPHCRRVGESRAMSVPREKANEMSQSAGNPVVPAAYCRVFTGMAHRPGMGSRRRKP